MTTAVSESTGAIGERVRDAAARNASLRIVGAGTWLDAGRPVDSSDTLSLAGHSGIVEYVPGDLTLTARAGTTLREIHDAVSAHGQWLALDPCGSDDGTIGATIATASAGPFATRFGAPRDLALGLEFVNGRGATIRGGGRVVKNVAGFDLTRLLTGSWGTLGVITEVTVRLHARPECDVSLAVPTSATRQEIVRLRAALKRWPFVPLACELVDDGLGRHLGMNGSTALFRLGGNSEAVAAQRRAIADLGDAAEIDPDVWRRFRAADAGAAVVLRLSRAPAEIDSAWHEAVALTTSSRGSRLSASPARGIVRCMSSVSGPAIGQLMSVLANVQSRVIAERVPPQLWNAPPLLHAVDPLQSRIREAFDPQRVLNRGILGQTS
jgi:glycolate oxidase FAD binding subunit